MTFSILAFDARTGELGAAVASRSLAVGGTVVYSRFGVGMVNTQNHAHLVTGQHVLDAMEAGASPRAALDEVLARTADAERRQLIAADLHGRVGAWTGPACDGAKHERVGEGCVAAGNTLAKSRVVDAMVLAFEAASGGLAERLLTALEAGQDAGGDRRGRQAAAIRVVPPRTSLTAINVDLRVDDHPEPLEELRRLLRRFRELFPGAAGVARARS